MTASYYASNSAESGWKIPFIFAILFHVLLAVLSFFTPDFLRTKPQFAQIHTVSLIDIPIEKAGSPVGSSSTQKMKQHLIPKNAKKKLKTTSKTEEVLVKNAEVKKVPAQKLKAQQLKIKKTTAKVAPSAVVKPLAQKTATESKAEPAKKITAEKVTKKNIVVEKTAPIAETPPKKEVEKVVAEPDTTGKVVTLRPQRKKIRHTVKEPVESPTTKKVEQVTKQAKEKTKKSAQKSESKAKVAKAKSSRERQQQTQREAQQRQKAKALVSRLREEALLEEQARLAREKQQLAQQALEEERALLRSSAATSRIANRKQQSQRTQNGSASQGGSSNSSLIGDRYGDTIKRQIQSFWALPVNLENKRLEATFVITVNKEGRIIDMFCEKSSGERVFDQFVEKTIKAANVNHLAPIPAVLKKDRMEFGLVFSPTGIQ